MSFPKAKVLITVGSSGLGYTSVKLLENVEPQSLFQTEKKKHCIRLATHWVS